MQTTVTFRILGLSAALLFPSLNHAALSFGIGPKGGLNLGNASVKNHDNVDSRVGMSLGATMEFGVTKPISFLVEPGFVQKGGRFDVSAGLLGPIHASGDLDYLELPVLVKAKFGSLKAHGYLFAGPSMGINVNADGKFGTYSSTFKNEASALVFSGDVGVGGAMRVRQFVYVMADARYSFGLSNSLKDPVADIDTWKNRDVRLQVGLLFHLTE